MITLGFQELLLFLLCAFVAFTLTIAFIKVWWRKWVLFSVAGIATLYLLHSLMWTGIDEQYKIEWYIFYFVSILAIAACVAMGVIDYVGQIKGIDKKVLLAKSASNNNQVPMSDDLIENLSKQRVAIDQQKIEEKKAHDEAVMSWFSAQLCDYNKNIQAAIMESAKKFADKGEVKAPSIQVEQNPKYTQARLGEMASAFLLLGRKRPACIEFLLAVFGSSFAGTKTATLSRKLIGDKKIHKIIFGAPQSNS